MDISLSLILRDIQNNNAKLNGSLAGNLVGALALIAAGVLPAEPGLRVGFLGAGAFVAICSRASVENLKRLYILLEEVEGRSYEQVAGAIAAEFSPPNQASLPMPVVAPTAPLQPQTSDIGSQSSAAVNIPTGNGEPYDWQLLNSNISETAGMALSQRLSFFDWTLFNSDPNKWPHLAIVGGTGDGKSFTAERLIPVLDGYPLISHPHWKPSDYPGYSAVYCGGRNYGDWEQDDSVNFESLFDGKAGKVSFASLMKTLEIEMDRRYKCYERGDEDYPMINVVLDELNTSLSKVPDAVESLKNLLREARKVKIRLICLLQSDNVKSLKLEGEGVLRYCWRYIRLGEFAAIHARKLRDADLIGWVGNRRFPILVEGMPAMLPCDIVPTQSFSDGQLSPSLIKQPAPMLTSPLSEQFGLNIPAPSKLSELEIEQMLRWLAEQSGIVLPSHLCRQFSRLTEPSACLLIERAGEEGLGACRGEYPNISITILPTELAKIYRYCQKKGAIKAREIQRSGVIKGDALTIKNMLLELQRLELGTVTQEGDSWTFTVK